MSRVLIVDDDPQLLRALRINLVARHHDVQVATTGADALQLAAIHLPDLVLLDLGLPDLDGVDVIHGLRGWTDVPIIVLSGRSGGPDKVAALDAGADDYVTKPFGVEELLARMRAVARRGSGAEGGDPVVRFGDLSIDLVNRTVTGPTGAGPSGAGAVSADSEPIHLTPTEWHVLEVFLRQPGALLSQRYLLGKVWGAAYLNQPANLRLYVSQLRRKLEPDPDRPRHLVTEPGMGYRFRP
ncbi:MAG: response regulator [Dermatophilaceae bacterium]|jgi:two-component system, OmpR family, KDP operon response regulator KdpE|nr:response regulator [Dermatophilaceae bacterium]HNV14224.1 response regulator [Dermatophilaceae bacterium]HQD02900.1 response regulator [Dermatophilaceae bacterium]